MNLKHIFTMAMLGIAIVSCDKSKDTQEGLKTGPFNIKVYDISAVSATVEVEPDVKWAPYYTDVLPESDFLQTQKYGFDDYMAYFLEKLENQTGKSREEVIDMISSYGNDGFILTSLKPETKYYAIAVGIGEDGMTNTKVAYKEFSTTEVKHSENKLTLNASEKDASIVEIEVNAENNDPYILAIEPVTSIEGLSEAEIADYIIQSNIAWGGLEQITYKGSHAMEYEGKSGWEYAVIAFGYEAGSLTTDLFRKDFMCKDDSNPESCAFSFGHEFSSWEMNLEVIPSDKRTVYICNIVSKTDLDVLTDACGGIQDALSECMESLIEDMIEDCGTRARVIDLISSMGDQAFSLKFKPETEYVQWAVPVDQNGNPTAQFSISEAFVSPAEVISDASLSLKSYRYFDGAALAELYPDEFKGAKNFAVVEMTVEPSATAQTWKSYIALEDLTDRSRETIIKNIEMSPSDEGMTRQTILAYWGTNTIMGVAKDADGIYGPLLLEVIELDKSNALPASEFTH